MAQNSKIQWTNHTWNPWHGCRKVSAGCKFCYMYRDKERYKQDPTTVLRSKTGFHKPLSWLDPALVFTCSWSDWFIEDADAWRDEAWRIIKNTPHLTYQILTKRPERILQCLPDDWGDGYENVWLGVSVENQEAYGKRIHELCNITAKVRFLSAEPLIGPIDMGLDSGVYVFGGDGDLGDIKDNIHWVIVGGESGKSTGKYRYRPCKLDWILSIIGQCYLFDVPVFVKQMGTHIANRHGYTDRHGGDIDEWPEHLRVREMPVCYQKTISI